VTLHSLGCKLNFAETASLRDRLFQCGMRAAEEGAAADVCIVNTCSVTEVADQKCRQAIHRMHRENPEGLMVVMGCFAQLQGAAIAAMEGVDLVVGMEEKARVVELIAEALEQRGAFDKCHSGLRRDIRTFVPSCSRGNRTRYFLKVQDGCDYFCTYCTIPMARGRSRSGSIGDLVAQARQVGEQGGKEIVITGVNIGDFGRGTGESLLDLLKALDAETQIARYRISSIEPDLLSDKIIDFCANSRAFMPHFHLPLQSGSDEVLRLMRRHYDRALFADRVARIKAAMPDAFIGVDVIVGMRGESDVLFDESFDFIAGLDVSQLHVFSYSERPGTRALQIPLRVAAAEKKARSARLIALSEQKRQAFYAKYVGTEREVLWEHAKEGAEQQGFTDNYIRVALPAGQTRPENSLERVALEENRKGEEALRARARTHV